MGEFVLYPWPSQRRRERPRPIKIVDSEWDKVTDEEIAALTIDERNAVGGRIDGSE